MLHSEAVPAYHHAAYQRSGWTWVRWAVIALTVITGFLTIANPALAFLVFLLPITFALLHGIRYLGAVPTVVSFAVIMLVSFTSEFTGVHTGFPFGRYSYNDDGINGPLLGGVPPLVTFSYVSMAYTCFVLARLILGRPGRVSWLMVFGSSAVAAAFMASWDLAFDPTMSTVRKLWTWEDGGAYFGVPIQNFVGWWLTTFVFFVIVTVLLNRLSAHRMAQPHPRAFFAEVLVMFAGNVIVIVLHGFVFGAADIAQAMGIVALLTLGTPLLLAALRLADARPSDVQDDTRPASARAGRSES